MEVSWFRGFQLQKFSLALKFRLALGQDPTAPSLHEIDRDLCVLALELRRAFLLVGLSRSGSCIAII